MGFYFYLFIYLLFHLGSFVSIWVHLGNLTLPVTSPTFHLQWLEKTSMAAKQMSQLAIPELNQLTQQLEQVDYWLFIIFVVFIATIW